MPTELGLVTWKTRSNSAPVKSTLGSRASLKERVGRSKALEAACWSSEQEQSRGTTMRSLRIA
jgi:hypothetical protein